MDDRDLIKLYRETKDERYFEKLFKRYQYLQHDYTRINNDTEFESLFNMVFLNVVHKYDLNQNTKFKTFLIFCLNNQAKAYKNNSYNRHTSYLSFDDYLEDTDNLNKHSYMMEYDKFEDSNVYKAFYDLLDEMYPDNEVRRNDIINVFISGLTSAEIARARGVSTQAVNKHVVKFKKKLKLILAKTYN